MTSFNKFSFSDLVFFLIHFSIQFCMRIQIFVWALRCMDCFEERTCRSSGEIQKSNTVSWSAIMLGGIFVWAGWSGKTRQVVSQVRDFIQKFLYGNTEIHTLSAILYFHSHLGFYAVLTPIHTKIQKFWPKTLYECKKFNFLKSFKNFCISVWNDFF